MTSSRAVTEVLERVREQLAAHRARRAVDRRGDAGRVPGVRGAPTTADVPDQALRGFIDLAETRMGRLSAIDGRALPIAA